MVDLKNFYRGKKILLTGHTGFKGSWMSAFLTELGGIVHGYALNPLNKDSLFDRAILKDLVNDYRADILDNEKLKNIINEFKPDIVFHFAAQPLVIESYKLPRYTWEVNVVGTLNLLENLRQIDSVKSIVIVTTDKVYKNYEKSDGYTEENHLGGHDPYSSSKAAVEILVESYYSSFFLSKEVGLATARSGNVIGGGDWSENRLIPDYYRAYFNKKVFELRSPSSVRPWQHVLDVINGYSILGMKLYLEPEKFSSAWNFGPIEKSITTRELISRININKKLKVIESSKEKLLGHETKLLKLNSLKSNKFLEWNNILTIDESIDMIDEVYLNFYKTNLSILLLKQIQYFIELSEKNTQ